MALWIIENVNGVQVVDVDPADPMYGEVKRSAKLKRAPAIDGTEEWDWDAGKWVASAERALAAADTLHRNLNPGASIEVAQGLKAIEAQLMLAGVEIDGQVAAEARALKIDPTEYARTVRDKAKAAPNAELDRIKKKAAIRKKLGVID